MGKTLVITDVKPLPADDRCPQCRAQASKRVVMATFGGDPKQACGGCGYEFPEEAQD